MTNKEIAIDYLNLIILGKIDDAFERYVSPDFRHHNPYSAGKAEDLIDGMKGAHEQFPNKIFEIKQSLADEDLVAVHSRLRMQVDAPEMTVVHIMRFTDDKIVELWDISQVAPKEKPNKNGLF